MSWCAALQQLTLPPGFKCLDLPGTRTIAGFGPSDDPLRTTFDACFRTSEAADRPDDAALKRIFPEATQSGDYSASYNVKAHLSGGASVGLGSLLPFLSGLSVSTSTTSSNEVVVSVGFKQGAIRTVSNLEIAFSGSSSTQAQKICKKQLCVAGASAPMVTTRVFVAEPTVTITAGDEFEVKGEVKALSTFGVSGDVAKSSGRSLALTASVPIILMYAEQPSPNVMGDACNLKISGSVPVAHDANYDADTIELDGAVFNVTDGARVQFTSRRLIIRATNSFIGTGARGADGTAGKDAFGPASSGGCKNACDEPLWEHRCPWNNSRSQKDFDDSLKACNACDACHCGADGGDAVDGGAGPTIMFTVAEGIQRNGSISYQLDGGDAGTPGRGGYGMAISNHGGGKVKCKNGSPGKSAKSGPKSSCTMKIGPDAPVACN